MKAVSARYKVKLSALKTGVDLSMLATSVIMSLCFFKKFVGIGWGTLIMAPIDGTLIGRFSRFLDRTCDFPPRFQKFAALFALEENPSPAACANADVAEISGKHDGN